MSGRHEICSEVNEYRSSPSGVNVMARLCSTLGALPYVSIATGAASDAAPAHDVASSYVCSSQP